MEMNSVLQIIKKNTGNVDISDTGTTIPVMTDDDEEIRIDIYTQDQHLYGTIE